MQQDVELNVIPLEATGTYHLDASEDFDVLGGAGVGVSIIDDGIDATDSETNLSFSPRIGASYAITDELRANLTGSYLVITNDNDNVDSSQLLNINLGLTYTILD